VTAEAELWSDDELCCEDEAVEPDDEPLEVEPLEVDPAAVASAVVAAADEPEPLCVEPVVAVLPSEPVAAMVPKASAKVASAAAMTRRRMRAIRRARARRRSRTRSACAVGGGVEGMRPS
jgi:hypothetical protein